MKSTVEEIRQRFDNDVERFSNLQTGQSATIDAPLSLELVVQAAATLQPKATHLLDIGCGAGNYSLKLLHLMPDLDVTLVDLSRPMLDRAVKRIEPATSGTVTAIQADIRELQLKTSHFNFIFAAAALHHLRNEKEWEQVFHNCYQALKPAGSFWIVDLITQSAPEIQGLMWQRYGNYLEQLKDKDYRDKVFAYIEKEDSPRPLMYQLELLRKTGFDQVEVLHKNSTFAAFGGIK